jgi:hypothetical protein
MTRWAYKKQPLIDKSTRLAGQIGRKTHAPLHQTQSKRIKTVLPFAQIHNKITEHCTGLQDDENSVAIELLQF